MVMLPELWLPIVLAAVMVFIVSSIVHMVLRYHRTDYKGMPDEEAVRAALGKQNLAPGVYPIPYTPDMKQMNAPETIKKYEEGPVALITMLRKGRISMGPYLGKWFVYCLLISFVVAYVVSRTLVPGTAYLQVFRVAGTAAWLGYAGGSISAGIWKGLPWSVVIKEVFDGLLYALATAGVFGALWPKG